MGLTGAAMLPVEFSGGAVSVVHPAAKSSNIADRSFITVVKIKKTGNRRIGIPFPVAFQSIKQARLLLS
jgi:hypothetical protein